MKRSDEATRDDRTVVDAALVDTETTGGATEFYCPACREPVGDPLACGDCASLICRRCGTPIERIDDLGIG